MVDDDQAFSVYRNYSKSFCPYSAKRWFPHSFNPGSYQPKGVAIYSGDLIYAIWAEDSRIFEMKHVPMSQRISKGRYRTQRHPTLKWQCGRISNVMTYSYLDTSSQSFLRRKVSLQSIAHFCLPTILGEPQQTGVFNYCIGMASLKVVMKC